jgi:hypothetical protein
MAAASEPSQQLPEPNPVPPCPECQAVCVVRLPRTWRKCDEFHCNKCAHQWEVWDTEEARATEPYTIELIKTRSAYSLKEAEARDEKGGRLDAEARVRAAEARDLEPIVRVESKLDKFLAQQTAPASQLATADATAHPTATGELDRVQPESDRRPRATGDKRPNDRDRTMANLKASDPSKYPSMTTREAAAFLDISLTSVCDLGLEDLSIAGLRKRLWSTVSVIAARNSQPK